MAEKKPKGSSMSQFTSANPADAGLMGRLIRDNKSGASRNDKHHDLSALATVFRRNIRNGNDYENILRTLPFLRLPISILISSIISPGDLVKQELSIRSTIKANGGITTPLDRVIQRHFLDEMKIHTKVYDWTEEALISRGSHPILVLPEASLDKMMRTGNYSEEGYKSLGVKNGNWYKTLGFITEGKVITRDELSFESEFIADADDNLLRHTIKIPDGMRLRKGTQQSHYTPFRVTDNPAVLSQPVLDKLRETSHRRTAYGVPAFEAEVMKASGKKELSPNEIYSSYFKPGNGGYNRLVVMPSSNIQESEGAGHPILNHLPPECVAAAFIPGSPEEPIGYWVAIDGAGYPASYLSRLDFYEEIRSSFVEGGSGNQQAGNILQLAKETQSGVTNDYSDTDIDRLNRLSDDIMERELISRIASTANGSNVKIGMTDAFSKMMFARWCRNQYTTLLYVPAAYMVYIAFDYTPFGVGKSLLEDMKELAAQTAAIKIANTLQLLKNAVPGKNLNIKLGADDKNPEETIVESLREAMALLFYHMPTNVSNSADIATQLQQSSITVNIEGNEYYPDMSSSVEDKERVNTQMDTTLYDGNIKEMNSTLGVPNELIDGMGQADFAVTAVQQSILLRKRVIAAQTKLNPKLSDLLRIYTMHSGPLCKELMEIITANAKDLPKEYKGKEGQFLIDYINSLDARLPAPIVDDLSNKTDIIEKFKTVLDSVTPAWVQDKFFSQYDPEEYKTEILEFVEGYKAYVLREMLRKHNLLPEMDQFTTDDDGQLVFKGADEMVSHSFMITESFSHYLDQMAERFKDTKPGVKKALKTVKKTQEEADALNSQVEPSEGMVEGVDDESGPATDNDNDDGTTDGLEETSDAPENDDEVNAQTADTTEGDDEADEEEEDDTPPA